jgi:hypothetical protein
MIRWLLVIPFALTAAVTASGVFFLVASVVDPVMASLTGETLFVSFWSLVDALFAVEDPGPILAGALAGISKLVLTLFVAPPALVGLIGEVAGLRRLAWYAGGTAALTAAIPWLMRGAARIASPAEIHVSLVLALTGAVAGLVYWMVAGQSAGKSQRAEPPRPIAPRPTGS